MFKDRHLALAIARILKALNVGVCADKHTDRKDGKRRTEASSPQQHDYHHHHHKLSPGCSRSEKKATELICVHWRQSGYQHPRGGAERWNLIWINGQTVELLAFVLMSRRCLQEGWERERGGERGCWSQAVIPVESGGNGGLRGEETVIVTNTAAVMNEWMNEWGE